MVESTKEPKSETIQIRCSKTDKDLFKEYAQKDGKSLSEFMSDNSLQIIHGWTVVDAIESAFEKYLSNYLEQKVKSISKGN